MILLDTNVVIAFFNGSKPILDRIQARSSQNCVKYVSSSRVRLWRKGISEGKGEF